METFWMMLKVNVKLILRNKQSFFLILFIPVLCTLILNLTTRDEEKDPAHEFKMGVYILNESGSELSNRLIETLENDPSMIIERTDSRISHEESVESFFIKKANRSMKSSFIYIPKDFENKVINGDAQDLILFYDTEADERAKLLEVHLNTFLVKYLMFGRVAQGNKEVFYDLINKDKESKIQYTNVIIDKEGDVISHNQAAYSFSMKMFVAALTVVMIFGNNIIIGLFFKEKHNQVLRRIQLTRASILNYTSAKIILAVISLSIQTVLIMLSIQLMVNADLGIGISTIGILIFGLGLVMIAVSTCSAVFIDSISTANYLGVGLIAITNMLAGLYFPLETAPAWMQNAAMFLPQRWFVFTASEVVLGNKHAFYQYGIVVGAMMIFFLAIALFGFKMNKSYS